MDSKHQEPSNNAFVCNMSREEIRANRKIKRVAKKEALKLEKQKERERKQYEDIFNGSKSEKVKLIREDEMEKYRRYLLESEQNISSQKHNNGGTFDLERDKFPDLSGNWDTTDKCILSSFENELTTDEMTTNERTSSTHDSYAQNLLKEKVIVDVLRDENSFPIWNQAKLRSQRSSKTRSSSSQIPCETSQVVIDQTISEPSQNLPVNQLHQSNPESKSNQRCSELHESNLENNIETHEIIIEHFPNIESTETMNKSDLNKNMDSINKNIKTKSETSEANPNQLGVNERKFDEIWKYKRRPYCCNLLQCTKIKQLKIKPKSIRKRKTLPSTCHNEGNLMDSTKPLKMNKGKHYMRDKLITRNKKRITKAKKIICNYRKLKNDTNFIRKPNFNIFLTREFLVSLNCQMERDFKFNNQHEKQILLFNEFLNKKNKNKLWDNMREYIKINAVRLKELKVNNGKDLNETVEIKVETECKESMKCGETNGLVNQNEDLGDTKEENYQNEESNNMDNVKPKDIFPKGLGLDTIDTTDKYKRDLCNKVDNVEVDRNSSELTSTNSNKISVEINDEELRAIKVESDELKEYINEESNTTDKQLNNLTHRINENNLYNQITNKEINEIPNTIIDKQINEINNSIHKQTNQTILNNEITNSIDKQINEITNSIDKEINETSLAIQITNSKKLKRLEKKRRKRQSAKLDETIVANKSKGDGIVDEDIKLNLNKIVDNVVETEDVDQLSCVKQQIHSRNFRPYCNQLPLPRLRKVSTDLIKQIVLFQERLFKSDPLKGQTKRRYLVGVKEVMKSLPIRNKVKMLFIAPDLECVPLSGGMDDDIQSLLTMATIQGVSYLFSIPRRLLGSLTHKTATSCLAVLDHSGCEEMVDEIISLIVQARTMYDERVLRLSNKKLST
ncbi:hypothetical protein WDU94_013834 [Cyamophila willieti]